MYQRIQRYHHRQQSLEPVKTLVLSLRRRMPKLGTRKLYHRIKPQLIEYGIKLGRDGLFSYLREQRLLIKPRRKYTKTTNSKHWVRKHPNLFKELTLTEPEQAFVSDITYLESDEGVHYLSLVTDAYSRKIMGYCLSHDLKTKHMVSALKQAIRNRQYDTTAIHHSDRGLQYCAAEYQSVLQSSQMKPSMTDGYDCYQNALAERVNGILKQEFLYQRCRGFDELKQLVAESISIYNEQRPHMSLSMNTPEQVHKKPETMLGH